MRRGDTIVKERTGVERVFIGRGLCVFGLVLAVVGAYFVSMATEALGGALGVAGYYLGARTLASATIVLCVVALFVGLLVGQGFIPGPYDGEAGGVEESIQDPLPPST
jgi:uncharacterized membrane protein